MPKLVRRCPHCKRASCYHCWECGADTVTAEHRPTCPQRRCRACGGSGVNSKGGACVPCEARGTHPTAWAARRAVRVKD